VGGPEERVYYAHKRVREGGVIYLHASPSLRWLGLFHSPDEVVKLRLRERRDGDPPSGYWGWVATSTPEKFSMVWPSKTMFDICFPNGSKASEESGGGRAVNLIVEELVEK